MRWTGNSSCYTVFETVMFEKTMSPEELISKAHKERFENDNLVQADSTWFKKQTNEGSYRLYIGNQKLYFSTFDEAKKESEKHMSRKPEMRIEALIETDDADFWAYEYQNKQWVPS